MKRVTLLLTVMLCTTSFLYAQRTDLSGLKFCIDPGHGGHNPANDRYLVPDPGTEFWESESNLQKALRLDTLLKARGAWVILTRYTNDYPNDADEPTLGSRVALANFNNVNWFHSIHSNAFNASSNYTLLLVRESTVQSGQPESPEALSMAGLISPKIYGALRTTTYYTRLDNSFLGYRLGVLSGLLMPGQLSEGSFHDVPVETRRLMNNLYRKREAYAIRDGFMQYFGVPADTSGIVAGIQQDLSTAKPINFSRVRLLPIDRVVTGDAFNNGYYMFDNLPAGAYTVRFETPEYGEDSVQVTLGVGATAFVDRTLVTQANPTVRASSPTNNDMTVVVSAPVVLSFSKPMDTATVRTAFSITPAVPGIFQWTNSNSTLTYTHAAYFDPWVTYEVRVDTGARAASGQAFDGNGDGVSGDPYVLRFTTRYTDIFPPAITSVFPGNLIQLPAPTPVVNITFNEPLKQSTVTTSNFVIRLNGGSLQSRLLEYRESNGQGGVTMFLPSGVIAGGSYGIQVSRVEDLLGNGIPLPASIVWNFSIAPGTYSSTVIDSVNPATTGLHMPPEAEDRVGVNTLTVTPTITQGIGIIPGNPGSLSVYCVWDTTSASWGVRVPLDTSSAMGTVQFLKTGTVLRAYVYGDGSRSQVRFCVADSVDAFPAPAPAHREVSRWFAIDWVGWRALHWDLEADTPGVGSGNGVLEGIMRFDGVQFRYLPGESKSTLQAYVDQIEVIQRGTVGVDTEPLTTPRAYALYPAFPNPFNPSTRLTYGLPSDGIVTLVVYDILGREVAMLVHESQTSGRHTVTWAPDGPRGSSSGVYIVRLTATDAAGRSAFSASQKILLLK